MKLYRKRNTFKPPVVKRNPAKLNRFHRKKNRLKQHFSHLWQFQTRNPDASPDKQTIKKFDTPFQDSTINQLNQPDTNSQKNWWTPVWSGLVIDREAKHKKAIKQAIWLYLYLLSVANRGNGRLFRKLKTIAVETGFHSRSIQRWLFTLREKGYIETNSTGRYLEILITRWKPISRRKKAEYQSDSKQADSANSHNSQSHNENL